MRRHTYIDTYWGDGWPDLEWLGSYFLTAEGRRKFFADNDSWGLKAYGLDATENLEHGRGRIDVDLTIQGHPKYGIFLYYHRYGDGSHAIFCSKGDPSRLREWVRTMHGDLIPVGMFIPFEVAWTAVKQFIETNAALPTCISWLEDHEYPADPFPKPWEDVPIVD
jgi:hypothetical protein